ncbi:MAG: hypothetical protein N2053_02085 [Chitinispirillaceae bacterium]|nr:hypothetical protein [Chitinispirillaceae bacterium]
MTIFKNTSERTYGGDNSDYGSAVLQTTDGGFIVVRTTMASTPYGSSYDIFLIKTDSNGNVEE